MAKRISFTNSQFKLYKQISRLSQDKLGKSLVSCLRRYYDSNKVVYSEDYVYAMGTIPVVLVAHLDTVHKRPPTNIFWDREKDVIWSPQGLGADDRAGVYAILQIISNGFKPHVVFTTEEEKGGIGAMILTQRGCPFKDVRFMIELDRQGYNDSVYYDCDNEDFEAFINRFGFKTDLGSFSDISELCPAWKVAGVNLSIGYFNEHTQTEMLIPHVLLDTISKVETILQQDFARIKKFKYVPMAYDKRWNYYSDWAFEDDYPYAFAYAESKRPKYICSGCKHSFLDVEVIPTKSSDTSTVFYCPDCVDTYAKWCDICGEAFEKSLSNDRICPTCKAKIKESNNEFNSETSQGSH